MAAASSHKPNGEPRVTATMLKDLHVVGRFIHEDNWDAERAKISAGFGKKSSKEWTVKEYYSIFTPMKERKDNADLFEEQS